VTSDAEEKVPTVDADDAQRLVDAVREVAERAGRSSAPARPSMPPYAGVGAPLRLDLA
jgi:hypothetical protein